MMLQSLRDWLIRALGGVTESERVLQCREWIAIGRFQAQVDNMAHAFCTGNLVQHEPRHRWHANRKRPD